MPGRVADSVGTVCAPLIEASNSNSPCGMWQFVHWLSETCGRFTWFWPVAKFTLSWQLPQAARLGFFSHASDCVAPVTDCGFVAELAAPRIARQRHRRPVAHALVEADHLVRRPRLHARQLAAHMNLVNEDLHVHCVASVRIGGLRRVAHDAKVHAAARPAVERQAVVALVARRRTDHIARRRRAARRHPGQGIGRIVGAQVELGQVARPVYAHPVRGGSVIRTARRRRLLLERINEFPVRDRLHRPARVRSRLNRGHLRNRAGLAARRVRHELRLALGNIGHYVTHRDSARCRNTCRIQGQAFRVGQLVVDTDGSVLRDAGRDDFDRQARPHKIHRRRRGVIRLVMYAEFGLPGCAQQRHADRNRCYRQSRSTNAHTHLQILGQRTLLPKHSPHQTEPRITDPESFYYHCVDFPGTMPVAVRTVIDWVIKRKPVGENPRDSGEKWGLAWVSATSTMPPWTQISPSGNPCLGRFPSVPVTP